jgi:DNA-binding transcriptional MerR regulator
MKTEIENGMTIQQAAGETGLSAHTLRYYERIGLIAPVDRAPNGHRRYTEDDVGWIGFLNKLRATGMPIAKMKRYADLQRRGDDTLAERLALLEEHRREVKKRIQELEDNLAVIEYKIKYYSGVQEELVASHVVEDAYAIA